MATVKMKLPSARELPAGTLVMAYGYPGEIDADGFTIVAVPQRLAEHEAASGRLVYVDTASASAKAEGPENQEPMPQAEDAEPSTTHRGRPRADK